MIPTIQDFTDGVKPYIEKLDSFAKKHDASSFIAADHLGYKCASTESFEQLKKIFEENSEYIFQSIISSRRIAYIKLKEPILTDLGDIAFIELQDQKPDGSQKEKYDHVEGYPIGMSYDDMVKKLGELDTVIETPRPHHPTHDIDLGDGFSFKCEQGALLDKIKGVEMV